MYEKTEVWLKETNITLIASWTVNTYTITLDLNGGSLVDSGSPLSYTIDYGEEYTLPLVNTPIDSPFTGWYYQGTRLTNENGIPYEPYFIDEDISAKAEFFIPIANSNDLENIKNDLTGSYQLVNDIDLSGINWVPINYFEGSLNDHNFAISGMSITKNYESVGLFGEIGSATISNLKITDSFINFTTKISDEYIYIGALIGSIPSNKTVVLKNIVIGESDFNIIYRGKEKVYVGGQIGYIHSQSSPNKTSVTILDSGNVGNTTVNDGYIGGLVGYSNSYSSSSSYSNSHPTYLIIENSYNIGEVSGGINVGGLVGSATDTDIINSINLGVVKGSLNVGGIIGENVNYTTLIINSYYTNEILDEENNPFALTTPGGAYLDANELGAEFFINVLDWDEEVWDLADLDVENGIYPGLK